jgi:hypothetical protein
MLLPTASGAQQTMFLFAGCRTIAPRTTQELLPTTVHSLELTVRHRPKGIKFGLLFSFDYLENSSATHRQSDVGWQQGSTYSYRTVYRCYLDTE